MGLRERARVVEALPEADGRARRAHRVGEAVGEVELPGQVLEERRAFGLGEPVRDGAHLLPIRERLLVGARGRRRSGRGRAVGQYGVDVAAPVGVVQDPRPVDRGRGAERSEHGPVEVDAAGAGQALLDGLTGQLVAEGEHPVPHVQYAELLCGRGDVGPAGVEQVEQLGLGAGGDHRDLFDDSRSPRAAA